MTACADAGAAAGVVDLASLNLINAALASGAEATRGRLAGRPRRARLRHAGDRPRHGPDLLPHAAARGARGISPTSSTRPRCITRIASSGAQFARVVLSGRGGARRRARASGSAARLEERMGVQRRVARLPRHRGDARSHQRRRPSCSTRSRPPSASSSGSGWPDASHQPVDPAVLQRARRARRRGAAWRSLVLAVTAWQVVARRPAVALQDRAEHRDPARPQRGGRTIRSDAQQIRRGLDQKQLTALSAAAAKEANELIEQRTFSWTQLFNQLETTLPDDVMLTGVHPEIKDGDTRCNLDVQGRSERRHRRVLGSPREDRAVPRRRSGAPSRHRRRPAPDADEAIYTPGQGSAGASAPPACRLATAGGKR